MNTAAEDKPLATRCRTVVYWTATILLALAIGSGGFAELILLPDNVAGFMELGYPVYFMMIIGIWKVCGATVIVLPGWPRLKEWAYAGIFFNVSGAALSHAAVGSYGVYAFHVLVNLFLALLVVVSWSLRPANRVLGVIGYAPACCRSKPG